MKNTNLKSETKKCLIIVRASTDRQEIESQLKEVKEFAKLTYTDNEIVCVAVKGASAIKLNKEYLSYIDEIYTHLENNNIKEVIAWSLDRIGRNEEILMKFKNYCITNKIQLTIIKPQLQLLNIDGSVNNGIELAISLFATLSKQEMEIKIERFKRAKKHNSEIGKANGAKIKLGYTKDENGYLVIDEIWTPRIQHIFELYSTKKYSCKALYNELKEEGYDLYFSESKLLFNCRSLYRILRDKTYIGETTKYCNTKYPPIIDEKVFNKVQNIKKGNNTHQVKSNIKYFGLKIFKCNECNSSMVALKNNGYKCSHTDGNNKLTCSSDSFINIGWLDSILLYTTQNLYSTYQNKHQKKSKIEISKKINEINNKLDINSKKFNNLKDKKERIENLYIENGDKEQYDKNLSKLSNERKQLKRDYMKFITEKEQLIYNNGIPLEQDRIYNIQKKDKTNISETKVYELIHQFIKNVNVCRDTETSDTNTLCKIITITPIRYIDGVDMGTEEIKFKYYPMKNTKEKIKIYKDNQWQSLILKQVIHEGNDAFTFKE